MNDTMDVSTRGATQTLARWRRYVTTLSSNMPGNRSITTWYLSSNDHHDNNMSGESVAISNHHNVLNGNDQLFSLNKHFSCTVLFFTVIYIPRWDLRCFLNDVHELATCHHIIFVVADVIRGKWTVSTNALFSIWSNLRPLIQFRPSDSWRFRPNIHININMICGRKAALFR